MSYNFISFSVVKHWRARLSIRSSMLENTLGAYESCFLVCVLFVCMLLIVADAEYSWGCIGKWKRSKIFPKKEKYIKIPTKI